MSPVIKLSRNNGSNESPQVAENGTAATRVLIFYPSKTAIIKGCHVKFFYLLKYQVQKYNLSPKAKIFDNRKFT